MGARADGAQGQGAAALRIPLPTQRPRTLYLPAPRCRTGTGARAPAWRHGRTRLRDGAARGPEPAAARADERSGRAARNSGRRMVPGGAKRWMRRVAERSLGREAGERDGAGWGNRGRQRGAGSRRSRRRSDDPRRQSDAAALPWRFAGWTRDYLDVEPRDIGGGNRKRRPRDWHGADGWRAFARAVDASDALADEARDGAGRSLDRPRWAGGDLTPDQPSAADLCRRRRGALLRDQYAGDRAAYLDLRVDQRDPDLCVGTRGPRRARGGRAQRRHPQRGQHLRRPRRPSNGFPPAAHQAALAVGLGGGATRGRERPDRAGWSADIGGAAPESTKH